MKKRNISIDLLRTLCIIAVIFIHTTTNIMVKTYPNMQSKVLLAISIITSCAVPLFYMISGAFSINEKNIEFSISLKKAAKTMAQVIIWTIIYQLMFKYYFSHDVDLIKVGIKSLTSSQVSHLWFMYPLIGLYILLPIVSKMYLNMTKRDKKLSIIFLLIVPITISTLNIKYNDLFTMPFFCIGFPELGLFLLGKYLMEYKQDFTNKNGKIASIIAIIGGYVLIAFVMKYYLENFGISDYKPYFDYNKIPNVLLITGIFILFLNFERTLKKIPSAIAKTINYIGSNTLGIYFVHMIFLHLFPTIKIGGFYITNNTGGGLSSMFLGVIFYFSMSILSVAILQKIPIIKKLVK